MGKAITQYPPIHLCVASMGGYEEKYVKEAFDCNWIAPLGPNVDAFEKSLEDYLGNGKHVAALSSGTAALHLALVLAGVQANDEVLCQSWTFSASANPIIYQGATPIFVDSEESTWNISPKLLEYAIEDRINKTGKKPKAIIAVDLYGMPAKWEELVEISKHYDIPLIEDAAEALGSTYKEGKCGTFGQYGVVSFNGNKMITTSGGGALISGSIEEKKKALYYSTQARELYPWYEHKRVGYNYRLSNICAGIGRGQMEVLEKHIEHHRNLNKLYKVLFEETEKITVHHNPSSLFKSNFWLTTIIFKERNDFEIAETVREYLASKNIESRPLWKPMHLQPVFKHAPHYGNGISDNLWHRGLCLPSGPKVSEEDVKWIATLIKEIIDC